MVDPNEEIKHQKQQEQNQDLIDFFPINDIPSRGYFYSDGTKIYGRRLNVSEVKKLAQLNEDNFDEVVDTVIQSTIKGIDILDLKRQDKLYILFWLRANSFRDNNFKVDFTCPFCLDKLKEKLEKDKTYKPTQEELQSSFFHFKLEHLQINYLPEKFKKEYDCDGHSIEIDYESVRDQRYRESHFAKNKELDFEILELASNLGKIDGKEYMLSERYKFLSTKISPEGYVKLESYVKKNEFGFKDVMIVKCNKCGGDAPVGVTFCKEFMLPKIEIS